MPDHTRKDGAKTVAVEYFAIFRERRGCSSETVTTHAATAAGLYAELAGSYAFPASRDHIRVAINQEFKAWDTVLANDDTVVFIPPVAGG